MQYAKIEANAVAKLAPRPNWRYDNGEPVKDETLSEHGWLPVVYEVPEHDPVTQRVALQPQSMWLVEDTRVVATYEITPIPYDEIRQSRLDAVTAKRWEVETGGLTLPSGVRVDTSTEDQNRITSVIANAELAGVDTVDFKAASGWVALTLEDLKQIAAAIARHVQACFSAERAHHEAIANLDDEDLAAYDVNAGWPRG